MKKIFLIFAILIQYTAFAQVKFEAVTDKDIYALNEKILLTYIINNDGDNFDPPRLDGFRVEGPSISKGKNTSITIVNGKVNSRREIFTQLNFFLTPKSKGTFTIQPATIEYEGVIYKSNPVVVKIVDAIQMPVDPNDPLAQVGEGVFLVADISKQNPYVNEPVTVVYKVYFDPRYGVNNVRETENPAYNGFWSQFQDMKNLKAVLAKYNGKDYAMVEWRKVILYPLEAGNKNLDPLTITMDVNVPVRRTSYSESPYQTVRKTISAGARAINVKPLPEVNKPIDFKGAVGDFAFKIVPSKKQVKYGESLDLVVEVSGKGNLKLFELPKLELPSAFDVFEPKHNEEVNTPLSGMIGKISDTYTIVPQTKGKYPIKPLVFSYFDLKSNSYKTISSEEFIIDVIDGPGLATVASNDPEKQDITKSETFQFINRKTNFEPINKSTPFGSNIYYSLLLLPLCFIPILFIVKRKTDEYVSDEYGNKIRMNNKLAKKYLGEAKKQLGNKVPFYLAIEKALHNFLKAKLNIETSEMDKENIQLLLVQKNASQESVANFINIMKSAEFARYAPSSDDTMKLDFEKAVESISLLEKELTQTKSV
ncbi:BatD family protein [uncultured Flavobacterium sp.]|uniref:BatD family protein n=1 Tax=uncultured Flavobacterium sp. TaxID=165435 RepID=UPI0030EE7075|tara:strand:- start:28595 stop:30376 length:1782 start_codon:yes stop_codon:yes gene_type:complete